MYYINISHTKMLKQFNLRVNLILKGFIRICVWDILSVFLLYKYIYSILFSLKYIKCIFDLFLQLFS